MITTRAELLAAFKPSFPTAAYTDNCLFLINAYDAPNVAIIVPESTLFDTAQLTISADIDSVRFINANRFACAFLRDYRPCDCADARAAKRKKRV